MTSLPSLGLSFISYLGCSSGEAPVGGWVYICVLSGLGGIPVHLVLGGETRYPQKTAFLE